MLLVADVGNTNITFGVFFGEEFKGGFRITTKIPRTSDEFSVAIEMQLKQFGMEAKESEDVIVASVVPNIMHSFNNGIMKLFGKMPLIIGPGVKTGIKIRSTNPQETGADRIVDCVAVHTLYGGPCLVIDFGTATTFDYVTKDGAFEAGVTVTGVQSSAKAMAGDAAKLPEIEIKMPNTILAKNTIQSMQAGLMYGYIGQVEYIIDRFKKETKLKNLKVVATGGLGRIISKETKKIDIYDPELTLKGLRIIYEKNKNREGTRYDNMGDMED